MAPSPAELRRAIGNECIGLSKGTFDREADCRLAIARFKRVGRLKRMLSF